MGIDPPLESTCIPYSIRVTSRYRHTFPDTPFHEVMELGIDLLTTIAYTSTYKYYSVTEGIGDTLNGGIHPIRDIPPVPLVTM